MFQELFMLIAFLFFGMLAVILTLALISYIKEKLVDRFGHELKNTNEDIRKAYVMKSDDENLLKEIALNDRNMDVRIAALDGITDLDILNEISENGHGAVSRIAKRRVKEN